VVNKWLWKLKKEMTKALEGKSGIYWHLFIKIMENAVAYENNKIIKLLFQLISLIFYSNFEHEYSLDAKFNSSSKENPCCILSTGPDT